MRRRTKWFIAAAVSLAGIGAFIFFSAPREPRYQDRPLSGWLADLNSSNYQTQRVARAAIVEMGPDAVPFLTNSLAQRKSIVLRVLRKNVIPRRLVNIVRNRVRLESPVMESRSAAMALQALGATASNAVPALIEALRDPSLLVSSSAAIALGSAGTNALPEIARRLQTPNLSDPEAIYLLRACMMQGTNAAPIASTTALFLESRDAGVSFFASQALARIGAPSIPIITNLLAGTNAVLQLRALNTLVQMGEVATAATNAFLPFMSDPDPALRLAARQALASTYPPDEFAPVWEKGLKDPDIRIVETSLRQLIVFPKNVRAYSTAIAELVNTSTNLAVRNSASNALTIFKAWPK